MPAPTTYSEAALKSFMIEELGAVGTALSLTTSTASITNAVYAVERLLGVSDVATATDMSLVEAAARWKAWGVAEASVLSAPSKLKSDGDEIDYSQRLAGIQERLSYAESGWYVALAASEAANGTGPVFFGFATVPGCRGR